LEEALGSQKLTEKLFENCVIDGSYKELRRTRKGGNINNNLKKWFRKKPQSEFIAPK
jgi:hypothetical protein